MTKPIRQLLTAFVLTALAVALPASMQAQVRRDTLNTKPPARQQGRMTHQDSLELRAMQQQLGTGLTQQQVVERLQRSGLSRAEVRTRLQIAGYDPSLA